MSQSIKVAQTNQIPPGLSLLVQAQGRDIALFNVDGRLYAIDNACSHSRGPLAEGRLAGSRVTCPWHGAQFDVTTGRCLREPATTDITCYTLRIDGEAVFVEIP